MTAVRGVRCSAEEPSHSPERQRDDGGDGPTDGPDDICNRPEHKYEPPLGRRGEALVATAVVWPLIKRVPDHQVRKLCLAGRFEQIWRTAADALWRHPIQGSGVEVSRPQFRYGTRELVGYRSGPEIVKPRWSGREA
ncbi:hypothetical protein GCM10009579_04770 [Streptomyces javensis]|uniref:Uncharacterized protein n=1 Tax=Streptomyces javensis TaxID=114698 RepID=A0ABN1WHD5_9ACTN